MKYKKIFSFTAMDEIAKGKTVYMLDREEKLVYEVNNMAVSKLLRIIEEENSNRYSFWYESPEVQNGEL